jgi:hypothetical protein
MHSNHPARIPMMEMKVWIGRHGNQEKADCKGEFHHFHKQLVSDDGILNVFENHHNNKWNQNETKDPQFPRPLAVHLIETDRISEKMEGSGPRRVKGGKPTGENPAQVIDSLLSKETSNDIKDHNVQNNVISIIQDHIR